MTVPRPAPPRHRLWLGVSLAALLLVGFAGCRLLKPKPEEAPYRTTAVAQGAIVKSVSASGTLEALVTVEVGSQISGLIRTVLVDFNDQVHKGQVLAVLDPQTYQSRLAQGRADVEAGQAAVRQAEAQAAQAQADFNRKRSLVAQGVYSPAVLDQSQAAQRTTLASLQAARARVTQSRASLNVTQVDLDRTQIYSPIDGVVVDRKIEPGQTVAASFQAPVLFRIAQDLSKVQVKISVDEADIGQVREGQAVKFSVDAFPDEVFQGQVVQVRKQPVTEQSVVAYTVMARADNPDGKLLPGMTANADIVILRKPDVLKVPTAALRWTPPSSTPQQLRGGPPGMGGSPGGVSRGGAPGQRIIQQLDLTPAQQKLWSPIETDLRTQMAQAAAGANGDRAIIRQAMQKNLGAALGRLSPSLTKPQNDKLTILRTTIAEAGPGNGGYTGGIVYVLREGKPTPVAVQVGVADGVSSEVRGGLRTGDQVITGGGPKGKFTAGSPFGGPSPGGSARGPR